MIPVLGHEHGLGPDVVDGGQGVAVELTGDLLCPVNLLQRLQFGTCSAVEIRRAGVEQSKELEQEQHTGTTKSHVLKSPGKGLKYTNDSDVFCMPPVCLQQNTRVFSGTGGVWYVRTSRTPPPGYSAGYLDCASCLLYWSLLHSSGW